MKNLFNMGAIVLVLAVLGCSCPQLEALTNNKGASPTPAPSPASNATPTPTASKAPSADVFTKAQFDQIKKGLTRQEVERILGSEGTEVTTTKGGGLTFTVVRWTDADLNYAVITFKNNKVETIYKSELE